MLFEPPLHFSIPTSKWLLVQIFVSVRFSHSNYDSTRSRYVLYHFTDNIYICVYIGTKEEEERSRWKTSWSRKMSREGYDARWNRRITLEGGQLFLIYIYIRRPITGNRGSSCSCSKWSDRRVENVEKRSSFRIFYWLPGNWIIISSKSIAAQKLIKRSPILIDN